MHDQMRRTPPDRAGRLPAPRAVLVPRSRLAPLAIALPLVLGLWLTIGLPILAEVSGTAGGGGPMRDFLFGAAATGGSPGGDKRGPGSGHRGCRGRRSEDRARGAPGADPRAHHRLSRPASPQRRAQAWRRPQRPRLPAATRPRLRSFDLPAERTASRASGPPSSAEPASAAGPRPAAGSGTSAPTGAAGPAASPASAGSPDAASASASATATAASAPRHRHPRHLRHRLLHRPRRRLRHLRHLHRRRRPRCRRPLRLTRSTAAASRADRRRATRSRSPTRAWSTPT